MCHRQSLGPKGLKREVPAAYGEGGQARHVAGEQLLRFGIGQRGGWQLPSRREQHLIPSPGFSPDLEAEASLPEKKGNTLSRDLIDYVRYMVQSHGEDYKVSAPPRRRHRLGPSGGRCGLFVISAAWGLFLRGNREEAGGGSSWHC